QGSVHLCNQCRAQQQYPNLRRRCV
ncbi:alpha-amylase domain protein, partial [Vibrio parahaemolyticus SBR10290]